MKTQKKNLTQYEWKRLSTNRNHIFWESIESGRFIKTDELFVSATNIDDLFRKTKNLLVKENEKRIKFIDFKSALKSLADCHEWKQFFEVDDVYERSVVIGLQYRNKLKNISYTSMATDHMCRNEMDD